MSVNVYDNGELKNISGGSGGGAISYTTEEVPTGGTWIDGKPIYRKVFSADTSSVTSFSNPLVVNTGLANVVDNLIKFEATRKNTGAVDSTWFTSDFLNYGTADNYLVHMDFVANTGELRLYSGSNGYKGTAIVIMEYTKTN